MRFDYEGTLYTLDIERVPLSDWRFIKQQTGFAIGPLFEAFGSVDPDAVAAVHWLTMRQANKPVELDSEFSVAAFMASALPDEDEAEADASPLDEEAEASPTDA